MLFSQTVVDCGPESPPTNGTVSFDVTVFGSFLDYSCDPGYSLVGDNPRTCLENGDWSGTEPSCDGEIQLWLFGCFF